VGDLLVAVALTHGQHPLAVAGHRQVAVAPLLALGRLAPERPAPPGGRVDQVDALVVEVDLDQACRTVAADQRVGATAILVDPRAHARTGR